MRFDPKEVINKLLPKFLLAPLPIGVEINESCLKVVLVKQESPKSACLLDYKIVPLAFQNNDISSELISIIKDILKEKSYHGANEARFVISGKDTDAKRLRLPFMPKDEIDQALRWQAKDHFLFNVEDSILDFEVLEDITTEDGARHLDIIANIAKRDAVEYKLLLFKDVQLLAASVVPTAYALYNLYQLSKEADSDKTISLIDIGLSTTNVVILNKSKIRFIREFSGCGGKDFTNALTATIKTDSGVLTISPAEAEELKKEVGIPEETQRQLRANITSQHISSMIRPIVERLVNEIKRSFNYYTAEFKEKKVEKIYISGGTSKLKNLDSYLAKELGIEVKPLTLPEGLKLWIEPDRIETFRQDFPILAPALGAALSNPLGFNLIPEYYKKDRIRRIRDIVTRLIFIIICLILTASYIFNVAKHKALLNILAARQPYWLKVKEIKTVYSKIAQKKDIVNNTLENQVPIYYMFKALSTLTPNTVYFEKMTIKDKASNMNIQGIVFETNQVAEENLAQFIKVLEDSPFFGNVYPVSSRDRRVSGKNAIEFEIRCNLKKLENIE